MAATAATAAAAEAAAAVPAPAAAPATSTVESRTGATVESRTGEAASESRHSEQRMTLANGRMTRLTAARVTSLEHVARDIVSTLQADEASEDISEQLFEAVGDLRFFGPGEEMIVEGQESGMAMYIRSGNASMRRGTKEVKRAGPGDVIGEMTLLLGDTPNVTIVADGEVEVFEVDHEMLIEALQVEPRLSGRVFKMFAVLISERIAETSKRARDEVVVHKPKSAESKDKRGGKGGELLVTAQELAEWRKTFGLPEDEALQLKMACQGTREANAKKDELQYGDLFVFEDHLCFEWRIFAFTSHLVLPWTQVLALLSEEQTPSEIQVQAKGYSYELVVDQQDTQAWSVMESCRRASTAKARMQGSSSKAAKRKSVMVHEQIDSSVAAAFGDAVRQSAPDGRSDNAMGWLNMKLTDEDWKLFLSGAKQRRYRKGDFVLTEGRTTHALYQILKGTVRVELQLKERSAAIVVGHRGAGEMFGETSLLKAGKATASIVVDSDEAMLTCIEGQYLEHLFTSNPQLPSRFFAFLASYQAGRLRRLTASITSGVHEVHGHGAADIEMADIFANQAFLGIFRQFLSSIEGSSAAEADSLAQSVAAFDFVNSVREEYRSEPDLQLMGAAALKLLKTFVVDGAPQALKCLAKQQGLQATLADAVTDLRNKLVASGGRLGNGGNEEALKGVRSIFDAAVAVAVEAIREECLADFLDSDHFTYILELKAKEGRVPGLPDFRLIRVLGEGGFGQVLEVVKRDCGKHYAMKVMHKDMMRNAFGGHWRTKILLEKDLMASLHHPFLVNLSYAFQNPDFLVLIMDLVPGGDLSEYVLTKKRLTAAQVQLVIMETVIVIAYCHTENVLYRDLKPENLLIDPSGHVRLIDMGLAARTTPAQPRRMTKVGTDCYMAPEVRWADKRRAAYGVSCDWYTVGVLMYEFTAGDLPYANPEDPVPAYTPFKFPSQDAEDLVRGLLEQDHTKRLGSGPEGVVEIQRHPYWGDVEWDLVPLKKFESPCKGLQDNAKTSKKKRNEKEQMAIGVASEMAQAEARDDQSAPVALWDFASSKAIAEEYMENMYHCVSAI